MNIFQEKEFASDFNEQITELQIHQEVKALFYQELDQERKKD